jgi:hypothetical protein
MAGEIINYANYMTVVGNNLPNWIHTYNLTDTNKTIIAVAPSFRCVASVSSVLFRSNWVRLTASYWNGSGWTTVLSGKEVSKSGAGSASFSFNHNREKESTDPEDNPHYHIWKLDVTMKGKDGSAHGYFDLYCGGLERMSENEYNEVFKGKKIQCCKPDYWTVGGTYASAEACVAAQRPSVFRGTPLSSGYSWMSASNID